MRRGEVYDARLEPTEGFEQASFRPIVVVSRDAIHEYGGIVIAVPCTTLRPGRRVYPSQTVLGAGEGGLEVDSVALAEQVRVLDKRRLSRRRGMLSAEALARVDRALAIALDLPGQF
jgi:mRNA interferase MazF